MNATEINESAPDLLAHAVRELARRTGFPVAFGGLSQDDVMTVTTVVGSRTRNLEGLQVRPLRGLGGRAMTELRPRMTHDYRSSRLITHDYDHYILGEGLRTLLAFPVVIDGRSRGVLYAGSWDETPINGVSAAPAMQVVEALASELRVHEEIGQRRQGSILTPSASSLTASNLEELRESFAELRSIACAVDDPDLRDRIIGVEKRLLTLSGGSTPPTLETTATVHLSPRETDVLAGAALGRTNAEVAADLGLRETTVKAYLATAMSKLGASTRHAAVSHARRAGLLP